MKPRYEVEIPIREARGWVKSNFGPRATIPHGSRTLWIAGLQYVTDQPGVYLTAAAGGMCGVRVIEPAKEGSVAA